MPCKVIYLSPDNSHNNNHLAEVIPTIARVMKSNTGLLCRDAKLSSRWCGEGAKWLFRLPRT
jgi:hypothetical protein